MISLVTGGAGFIGSHLVDRLIAEGQDVVVVDDLSTGARANLASAELSGRCRIVELDIADPALGDLVDEVRPDTIFHLAAQMDVRRSVGDPMHDTRVNVIGTVNVLNAAVRAGVSRVVFASSGGTVYGEPEDLPVPEDAPLRPASPYGAAKAAGEAYVAAFGRLHGLAWTSLRLGNVYGPRQDPHGEAGVVAIFGRALFAGEQTTIYGDGSSSRDYIHVQDVVEAFCRCLSGAVDGECLNVGTGRVTTVRELHTLVARAAGAPDRPAHQPRRAGELQRIALDSGRLAAATGWSPHVSLEAGLANTVRWIADTTTRAATG